jgi:hypothetical protein
MNYEDQYRSNLRPFSGGIHQYSLNMLRALYVWKSQWYKDEFGVFLPERNHSALLPSNGRGWAIEPLHPLSPKRQTRVGMVHRILGGELYWKALLDAAAVAGD